MEDSRICLTTDETKQHMNMVIHHQPCVELVSLQVEILKDGNHRISL